MAFATISCNWKSYEMAVALTWEADKQVSQLVQDEGVGCCYVPRSLGNLDQL